MKPSPSRSRKSKELESASYIWTNEPQKKKREEGSASTGIFGKILLGLFGLVKIIGSLLVGVCRFFWVQIRKSRAATAVFLLVCVLLVVGLVDTAVNWGKIYPGVKVGSIDLSDKSIEEARQLVEDTYEPRLMGTDVNMLASQEALTNLEATIGDSQNIGLAEQQSIESMRSSKQLWTTDAALLSASLDVEGLIDDAVSYGRENGGVFSRLYALLFGHTVKPRAVYAADALESLAHDIDNTVGHPRVNYNIQVVGGIASITEGHDGHMINRETFKTELDDAFFNTDGASAYRVARVEYAPLQIDREGAQKTCDHVNSAIQYGILFNYEGTSWNASPTDVGNWISTKVIASGSGYSLQPSIDYAKAKSVIFSHLKVIFNDANVKVRFTLEDDVPMVKADTKGVIPLASNAVGDANDLLFPEGSASTDVSSQPVIEVAAGDVPEKITFEEALDYGIISTISSFTTEFSSNAPARNHNIHLVAERLNNAIVTADGGIWSFNGIAGNCNAEAGFQGAGAIVDGEYVDEIGGGICQVATTIFNAVYDSGYPITERHNHTLYISSYPAGKDAAVSWPDLDLTWKNDSSSDVLVKMSYTGSSVTATLYGSNPGYVVSTEAGNWVAGEKFKSKVIVDSSLPANTSKIKTEGTDGRSITVVRTVKDASGNVRHRQTFTSRYDPKTEVRVVSEDKKNEATKEGGQ